MVYMKLISNERFLWSRTIGPTILGEDIDSILFMMVAFAVTIPAWNWLNSALTICIVITLYEMLVTPLTIFLFDGVKKFVNLWGFYPN